MRRAALAWTLALAAGCAPPGAHAPQPLEVLLPRSFPPMPVDADNPTTVEGVALGRQLYYDRRLSQSGNRACADCHRQERSFTNPSARGVLPHVNLAWSQNFLWDGGFYGTLEQAMQMEVEEFFHTDLERLREPDLEAMFADAFGTPEVTSERAARALAQFQRTLVSHGSRFDRYVEGDQAALSEAEVRGLELFYSEQGECFHCHATRLLTDNLFHDVGLDAVTEGTGRAAVTGQAADAGRWKTPTLRNVAVSGPYMHDDRFETLEQVIAFYSEGVASSPNLDVLVPAGGYRLSAGEQADLVAFLHALTDEGFLEDPALGPP